MFKRRLGKNTIMFNFTKRQLMFLGTETTLHIGEQVFPRPQWIKGWVLRLTNRFTIQTILKLQSTFRSNTRTYLVVSTRVLWRRNYQLNSVNYNVTCCREV